MILEKVVYKNTKEEKQVYNTLPITPLFYIDWCKNKKDVLTPSEWKFFIFLFSLQNTAEYIQENINDKTKFVNINCYNIQRMYPQTINKSTISNTLKKLLRLEYIIPVDVKNDIYKINIDLIYKNTQEPINIIKDGGYLNESNKKNNGRNEEYVPTKYKNNKNTSTDIKNLKQDNLSQESNINTSIENKVSQIEEKEPVIENQVITLKNDDSDLDFDSPTNIINENTSTDNKNIEREQLSQESNISTSNEIKSSQIEEKESKSIDITGLVINKNNIENNWLKYADKNSIAYNEINRFTQQSLFNFYCYNKRNFNSCTQEEKYMYFNGIPNYNSDFLRRIFLEIDRICSTYNDREFNKFYNSMVEPFNAYI